jgi:tRNA dimethylallyltransferase
MKSAASLSPLVAVLGPTASGKSALAVWLAQRFGGEVLACDSTQLFRGFDIGTAKPSSTERGGVPHHLLDVLDPTQEASAGGYRDLAMGVLNDLRARRRLPVLTVGTGLYLRALLEGLADLPQRSEALRERLRASTKKRSPGHLHRLLQRLDPVAAKRIAPADGQKLIRAVEVCLLARKPLTEVHRAGKAPLRGWRAIKIGLQPARDALYERIQARTVKMLAAGWLAEVRVLFESGFSPAAKPFDFIGYRQLLAVLEGQRTLEEASAAIQQATRRYAKRQITWFRKESNVHWFLGFGDDAEVQQAAFHWLRGQGLEGVRRPEAGGV